MYNPTFKYRGARALVILHEHHLREFLDLWKDAKAMDLQYPASEDQDYQSLETILHHVLRASRGYMTWICDMLKLPDPKIKKTPALDKIEAEVDEYLEHLLEQWKQPLVEIEEIKFHKPEYTARWKVNYCIEAMMEHAVMHPIRHSFQLEEWMVEDVEE